MRLLNSAVGLRAVSFLDNGDASVLDGHRSAGTAVRIGRAGLLNAPLIRRLCAGATVLVRNSSDNE